MAAPRDGSQSGWHVGTLRERSAVTPVPRTFADGSNSPGREERRPARPPSVSSPMRPNSAELLAAMQAPSKPIPKVPGGSIQAEPMSPSTSRAGSPQKILVPPFPTMPPPAVPPPPPPVSAVPLPPVSTATTTASPTPQTALPTTVPTSPSPNRLRLPPTETPTAAASISPRQTRNLTVSAMRVLDKDEIARRKRELENFDASFLGLSRGIVVDCKEMTLLVSQVANLVNSKSSHLSPKQRFVDLAMRTPKSCMSVCELVDQRIAESLFASLKREQELLQLCGRTLKNRVFGLVRIVMLCHDLRVAVAAQAMKDAENAKEPDLVTLANLTSETAKSVKALLAAGSTLKLKESSLTQQLQTRMRAMHTTQKLRLNESAKENALVMKAMLQANTTGDREQFLQLGRALIVGFTKLMKEFKQHKVKTEERRLQQALSILISDAKLASKDRTKQSQETVEKSKAALITAMKDYINAVLNAIDSSAIVYDGESLRALDRQQVEAAIKIQRRWRQYLHKKGRVKAIVKVASEETPGVVKKAPKEYAVEEVLTSEESYLKAMRTLIREFVLPLRKSPSTSPAPFITIKDVTTIFSTVEQIVGVTERMIEELKRAKSEVGTVANAFLRMLELLGPYTEYTSNFDRSAERIEALRVNPLFKNFVKECQNRTPGTLDMGSYLIMPVQRPPRYLILLEAVQKHTPPTDPDAKLVNEAVERLKVLNDEINNYKNEQDNRYAFASISRRTQDFPMDLYKPDRFFLREVDFEFMRPKKSFFSLSTLSSPLSLPGSTPLPFSSDKKQHNHFFIFNDLLVRAKDSYIFEEAIALSGFGCEIFTEVKDGEWALRMWRKLNGREEELQFYVPDETTRTLWVTQFTQLLQALEVGELCI